MDAIAGKDAKGRYWFKSDQYLTNISQAIHFYVKPPSYIFFWRRRYHLMAKFANPKRFWNGMKWEDGFETWHRVIGKYRTEALASFALEEVMKVLKIQEL